MLPGGIGIDRLPADPSAVMPCFGTVPIPGISSPVSAEARPEPSIANDGFAAWMKTYPVSNGFGLRRPRSFLRLSSPSVPVRDTRCRRHGRESTRPGEERRGRTLRRSAGCAAPASARGACGHRAVLRLVDRSSATGSPIDDGRHRLAKLHHIECRSGL